MSNKQIKWGVIGSGGIARRRTIPEGIVQAQNASLDAVYDINKTSNSEVALEFSAKDCSSLDELLSSDIDAVYVASPINVHLEHVTACAAAGKHVLCEKPLGMDVAEAEKMIEVCKSAGVQLGTALMMRFHTQHQEAKRMIKEGKIGDPVSLDRVLLVNNEDDIQIGTPLVEGVKVAGTIVEQGRGDKIIVFKFKRRKMYRRKTGHRQSFTAVRVDSIGSEKKK